jgi:iron complex outermembrane recepter protein
MTSNELLRRAVRCAIYANAAAASAGLPAVTLAQEQPAAQPEAAAAAPITEVIVTGSRIVEPGLQSISPVTSVSQLDIKAQGSTRIEDLLNNLPEVMADQGSMASNGASGTATVNLRGLGPQRTLVLINGRRLMPGDPSNTPAFAAQDLNNIPAALVERVDILTGGASAVYGADATAGVVNFVMNDHFQGFRIDANADMNNHQQHDAYNLAPAAGDGSAPSTVNDGKTKATISPTARATPRPTSAIAASTRCSSHNAISAAAPWTRRGVWRSAAARALRRRVVFSASAPR